MLSCLYFAATKRDEIILIKTVIILLVRHYDAPVCTLLFKKNKGEGHRSLSRGRIKFLLTRVVQEFSVYPERWVYVSLGIYINNAPIPYY